MGGGQREADRRNPGHGYDGTYAVRQADGRAQELQPEKQGEKELPADPDIRGGDAGIRGGRVAQRRPADGKADRPPSAKRFSVAARRRGTDLRTRGFGFLLLGSGGGVSKGGMPVHRGGAKDVAAGGTVADGGLAAVAEDRRRCPMRIPLSAGGLGRGVPLRGAAL